MNRKVLITGASRGIGRSIALAFAKEQDSLFLVSGHHEDLLLDLKKECETLGARTEILLCDLSKPESAAMIMEAYKKCYTTLDLLINNAGVYFSNLLQDAPEKELQTTFEVNLFAPMRLCKEASKIMVQKQEGRIINISSVYGAYGASMEVIYSASKGGLNLLTKSLAKELAPSNIAVNAISPGLVDTEMNQCYSKEELEAVVDEIPFGRMASPDEIGECVLLLSKAPNYLTGQIIEVAGGWF